MQSTKDFRLVISTRRDGDEEGINAEIQPTPTDPCKVSAVRVNGVEVTDKTKTVGGFKITNFGPKSTRVRLVAPKDHPPIRFEFDVECGKNDKKTFTSGDPADAESAIKGFLDTFINVLKKAADFLAGPFKDLPGDLREGLKKIKGIIAKGLDIVSNLLPLFKGLQITPAGLLSSLVLSDNLDHLKKKIGEHLKDLDPLDDSREAVLADAEALRLLILEDVIPYVQQVGAFAMNDLQQFTQRLSVMNKMTARLGDQLDMLGRSTKGKRKKKN